MRILIAHNFYAPQVIGGAELSVQGIAERCAELGHHVSVLTTGNEDIDETIGGVFVHRRMFNALMPYQQHLESSRSPKKVINKALVIDNPLNHSVIEEVIGLEKPDVVLSNNLLGITPELWRTAQRHHIPVMHTVRDYALLCPNSTLICSARPSCTGTPRLSCRLMRQHLRGTTRDVATVCAPSRYALNQVLDAGYFPDSHACVIPNAVQYEASKVRDAVAMRQRGRRSGSLRVAYVGRLVTEKGFDVLLHTIIALGERAELHVAGSGPLESEARRMEGQRYPIHLHGFLSQTELDELLLACDVLVAPSRYAETFGRIVYDAYRNAMPAIVSDAGALPEVLVSGTGVVVRNGDEQALERALAGYADDFGRIAEEGCVGALSIMDKTVERQAAQFIEELTRIVS